MKGIVSSMCVLTLLMLSGCTTLKGFFKSTITINQAIEYKIKLDASTNPAKQELLLKDIRNTKLMIPRAVVGRIIESNNVDYRFGVIVQVDSEKGPIECHVYSKDIETLARLKPNESNIKVEGDFSKFFKLLDDSFTKIEITEATIDIL